MPSYRIQFSRTILGVPFPVASITVRHARDAERARRAAQLRLMRSRKAGDWHLCADLLSIEPHGKADTMTRGVVGRAQDAQRREAGGGADI